MDLLRRLKDLPLAQSLRGLPVSAVAGNNICNDERGTNRYIYYLASATSFWRYDIYADTWQQLPSPVTFTFAAGVCMIYDPTYGTGGGVWLFGPLSTSPYAVWQVYDVAAMTWTQKNSATLSLAAQFGSDSCLAHTCTAYNAAGNDDYVYLVGNNGTVFYRYSISGDTWTTRTAAGSAIGTGCNIQWLHGGDADKLHVIHGQGTVTMSQFSISGNSWAAFTYKPAVELQQTGSVHAYCPGSNKLLTCPTGTHRMYCLDIATGLSIPYGTWPSSPGTAIVGDGLLYINSEGMEYAYFRKHSGYDFWRMPVFTWWD